MESIRRGEIYFANLSPTIGSEQSGLRPVLILQNNMGNQHSPTTIVAPITGTSMDKRDEFLRLIRDCKRGKIDRIITNSVARFARNTVDCLTHTRMLKEYNVDVYFEEQGIHSMQPGSEFYITIYGSVAQSESENISANVKWGKAQSAREGNVPLEKQEQTGSIMSMQHDCFARSC